MRSIGLGPETAVFRRLFLSDAVNQAGTACASDLVADDADNPVAVSIVEQPPLPGSKISLLAYHVKARGPLRKRRLSGNHVLVEKGARRQLWSTRLCAASSEPAPTSGVGRSAAANAANCSRGAWNRSNRPALTRAYPPSWFTGRLVSLKTRWEELNAPQASDQLSLAL